MITEAVGEKLVALSREDFDMWENVRRAFGRLKTVTRGCLGKYGVSTASIRLFARDYGLLTIDGDNITLIRGVEVVEKRAVVVRDDCVEEAADAIDDDDEARTWNVIHSFSPAQLSLLRCILANVSWNDAHKQSLVRMNPIKEVGYEKAQVVDLLNLMGFEYHEGSSGMSIPRWWEKILPLISIP